MSTNDTPPIFRNLAIAITAALKKLRIPTHSASTLKKARAEIEREQPELVLLDRRLPDGDGAQLCHELRESGFTGLILILSAAAETPERVLGLNAGADDYLPKPFAWEEFHARLMALARRRPAPSIAPTTALTWRREPERLRILGPKGWIELTPLEYKLADHLIAADGAIVSRDELLKKVWGFSLLPKTRTVDLFMSRLRKLFEEDAENPKHFLTVRGAGYRFERH
jgi:DNA-binding response OmpR family regulator